MIYRLVDAISANRLYSGLRGDHHLLGINCFTEQAFADARPVGVCGINEVDAEVDGLLNDVLGILFIFGGPMIPSPQRRIAPNPSRFTVNSPSRSNVPLSFVGAIEQFTS